MKPTQKVMKIPHYEPWIGEEELAQLKEVVASTWVTEGKKTKEFEERIAQNCGVKHAIAVFNCTMALYIALKAVGIGEGDEVIVPDFTFIASANVVKLAEATPVLVDVDRRTFNLDPDATWRAITRKTKGIMPVHIYGQAADMERLLEIARKKKLLVIEDAAQGVGVKFQGKPVGGFGDLGCLSFYGNKTITTGEGGMVLTNDDELAEKCRLFKSHGQVTRGAYVHQYIGYNFRITEMQAALGLAQLSRLEEILSRKRRIEKIYKESLAQVEGLESPYIDPRGEHVPWFVNILVENPQRLADFLAREGIETRRFFYPIHKQPCYNLGSRFPNSEYIYERGLSLPSSPLLSEEHISYVCKKVRSFLGAL